MVHVAWSLSTMSVEQQHSMFVKYFQRCYRLGQLGEEWRPEQVFICRIVKISQ